MMVGIILRTLPWDTEVHKCFADILDTVQKNFPSDFPSPRKKNIVLSYLHLDNYLYLKASVCKTCMPAAFFKLIAMKEITLAV